MENKVKQVKEMIDLQLKEFLERYPKIDRFDYRYDASERIHIVTAHGNAEKIAESGPSVGIIHALWDLEDRMLDQLCSIDLTQGLVMDNQDYERMEKQNWSIKEAN